MGSWKFAALGLIGVAFAGCSAPQPSAKQDDPNVVRSARNALAAALDRCGETHRSTAETAAALGEHEIGPTELDYRNPSPDVQRQIDGLIATDIAMTAAITQGTITRSQRKAAFDERLEKIKDLERAQRLRKIAEQQRRSTQIQQVIQGVQGGGTQTSR
jgi:hypothetical protein